MNYHQTPEEIIKAATPEQKILWNSIFLLYGERISIAQLEFTGALAGTQFMTYRARQLFFAYQLEFPLGSIAGAAAAASVTLYDANNVAFYPVSNIAPYWDATVAAARHITNAVQTTNKIFSRLTLVQYANISFIGYRLIY